MLIRQELTRKVSSCRISVFEKFRRYAVACLFTLLAQPQISGFFRLEIVKVNVLESARCLLQTREGLNFSNLFMFIKVFNSLIL